ncbi:MAG: tyrosine-type recombinase/integrase [Acidimicrobiales bacterium]
MSSIYKQKNGRYRARYRDPNGRTRSQSFDRLDDARRFLAGLGGDLLRGEYIDPAQARVRFDYWAGAWWASTGGLRPSTRCSYRARLDRHVLPYFGRRRVGSIDFATVELWLADRRQAGLGPKMLRECLSVLTLVLDFAVKSKALAQNPAKGHEVKVRRRKVREGDGVLTMEQVHQLVGQVRDPYKPAVWLLVFAGLRPAELCGLRVRDVDFVRRTVSIRATLMPVHGYGGEPWQMVEGPPKTEAGDRTVPIPAWLCDDLAAMLAARGDSERSSWLFQTRQRNPLHRDHFRENVVLPALRAAGLPTTVRTYDLRHSHASLLVDLGANPLAVAQRMGHSDAAFTLRVYGHLFEGAQAKLTEQLDALRQKTADSSAIGAVVKLGARRDLTQAGHA